MLQTDLLNDLTTEHVPADKGLRFANLIIDAVAFNLIFFLLSLLFAVVSPRTATTVPESGTFLLTNYIVVLLLDVLYYALFEALTNGKTPGKFITKTRAIREDDTRLTFSDAIKRSLVRLVPFEAFSAFGSGLWHDRWTHTMVIKDN